MKHAGKARRAALSIIGWTLVGLAALLAFGVLAVVVGSFIVGLSAALVGLWIVFALFTLFFFRDPEPRTPTAAGLIVSPAHGRVDVVDEVEETEFMEGPCHRVSTFLSVFDVHVQNAPVSGRVVLVKHRPGRYRNALRTESAEENECVLVGLVPGEQPGEKVGIKLIAGVLARRIVPWVNPGDEVARGERIGLIQFGSRVDLYLPRRVQVQVRPGDRVVGGETVIGVWQ